MIEADHLKKIDGRGPENGDGDYEETGFHLFQSPQRLRSGVSNLLKTFKTEEQHEAGCFRIAFMSRSRTSAGSRRISGVKTPVRSTPVPLNISQQSGKRIMIWPSNSTGRTISSRPFWAESVSIPVKRSVEEDSSSIFPSPSAH